MDPTLIVFIALSAFIAYRLYSVLGARTGEERPRDVEGLQRARTQERDEPETTIAAEPAKPLPPVSPQAEALRAADPNFDEAAFLEGARSAYEMIIEAFTSGDLKSIRRFLSPSVFEAFRAAVSARESAGHRSDLKFVGIESAKIAASKVEDGNLVAIADFLSNQVRATYDRAGALIAGDPSRIDLVKDRWTFSRSLGSSDPNWTLIATSGA
ncbi:MAG: Tim44 domain-containing protein [Parvularculaceae bacterium]|nr:Tim44 domain-containing protein [Parvularculaceae bacterium]